MIEIEVIFCLPDRELREDFVVPQGTTLSELVAQASSHPSFQHEAIDKQLVGIWGQRKDLSLDGQLTLKHGDRLEFYRPLLADAKTARRNRAKQQQAQR